MVLGFRRILAGVGAGIALITTALLTTGCDSSSNFSTPCQPAGPCTLTYSLNSSSFVINTPMSISGPRVTGSAPSAYAISPTSLPTGLTFNSATGAISGTPTVVSSSTSYTVTGTNSGGSVSTTLTFAVVAGPVSIGVSTVVASPTAGLIANGSSSSVVSVTLMDAGGNPVSGKTVTLSSSPTGDSISVASGTSTSAGVVNFTVRSTLAGTFTYTAVDSTDTLTLSTTPGLTFSAGPSVQLGFTTQPATASSGAALGTQPVVQVEDANGNPTGANAGGTTVTLAPFSNSTCTIPVGSMSGNAVALASGVATFTTAAYTGLVGTIFIGASTTGGLTSACSSAVTVTPGLAAKLAFTTEPSINAGSGISLGAQPVVKVEDAQGNIVTSNNTASIVLNAFTDPGTCLVAAGGALTTTTTLTASSGVANFSGITYAGSAGTIYIGATSAGLTLACSTGISVIADVQISANNNGFHTCAISTASGNVFCWGNNADGQLGNNTNAQEVDPVEAVSVGGVGNFSAAQSLATGANHTCALTSLGTVYCWGYNGLGQLGNNTTTQSDAPVQVLGLGGVGFLSGIVSIAAGADHTCALSSAGNVYCWGFNVFGQLGNATANTALTPVEVAGVAGSGFLSGIVGLAAGSVHTCAYSLAGNAFCWGSGVDGQLGNNATTTETTPVEVEGPLGVGNLSNVISLAAGQAHTCAINTSGNVFCWGTNVDGQLGNNTTTQENVPVEVEGVGGVGNLSNIVSLSAGADHTCASDTGDHVFCWGANNDGQLGNNTTVEANTPVQVEGVGGVGFLTNVTSVTAGGDHSCGLTVAGNVFCWGDNTNGQLGNNTTIEENAPVEVVGVGDIGNLSGI